MLFKNRSKIHSERREREFQAHLATAELDHSLALDGKCLVAEEESAKIREAISKVERAVQTEDWAASQAHEGAMVKLVIEALMGRAEYAKKIGESFSPQLVAALNSLRDEKVLETLSANFGDLSILEGQGLLATASRFLEVMPKDFMEGLKKMFSQAPNTAEKAATAGEIAEK